MASAESGCGERAANAFAAEGARATSGSAAEAAVEAAAADEASSSPRTRATRADAHHGRQVARDARPVRGRRPAEVLEIVQGSLVRHPGQAARPARGRLDVREGRASPDAGAGHRAVSHAARREVRSARRAAVASGASASRRGSRVYLCDNDEQWATSMTRETTVRDRGAMYVSHVLSLRKCLVRENGFRESLTDSAVRSHET